MEVGRKIRITPLQSEPGCLLEGGNSDISFELRTTTIQ